MNRLAVLQYLPLAIAVAFSPWWVSRKAGLDESGAYWRVVPLSRLKYLIGRNASPVHPSRSSSTCSKAALVAGEKWHCSR